MLKDILYSFFVRKEKKQKKKDNKNLLDEELRKRMKEAYEEGLKQGANIGKVL